MPALRQCRQYDVSFQASRHSRLLQNTRRHSDRDRVAQPMCQSADVYRVCRHVGTRAMPGRTLVSLTTSLRASWKLTELTRRHVPHRSRTSPAASLLRAAGNSKNSPLDFYIIYLSTITFGYPLKEPSFVIARANLEAV